MKPKFPVPVQHVLPKFDNRKTDGPSDRPSQFEGFAKAIEASALIVPVEYVYSMSTYRISSN